MEECVGFAKFGLVWFGFLLTDYEEFALRKYIMVIAVSDDVKF